MDQLAVRVCAVFSVTALLRSNSEALKLTLVKYTTNNFKMPAKLCSHRRGLIQAFHHPKETVSLTASTYLPHS